MAALLVRLKFLLLPSPIKRVFKSNQFFQDNLLILRQLQHFPGVLALAILFPLLASLFEGFGIGFLLGFLQNLINQNQKPFQTGLGWIDIWLLGTNESDLNRLIRISGLILLSTWLRGAFNALTVIYQKKAQEKLVNQLYKQLYEQLQQLSIAFYSKTKSGDILNTLTAEIANLRQSVGALGTLVARGANILVYALIALWISLPLTLLAITLMGLVVAGASILNRYVREASFPTSEMRGNFVVLIGQFVGGIRTVKAFATENYERQRVYRAVDKIMAAEMRMGRWLAFAPALAESLASTVLIVIIIVAVLFVQNGMLQVASLLTLLFTLFRIVPAVQQLNLTLAQLGSLQGSVQKIQELLRRDNKPYLRTGHRPFQGLNRVIEFVSVDFSYDAEHLVLNDIILTIEKGTTVALVGASGSGKSTLADLLLRFYDPTSGKILFDGVDQRELEIHSLRDKIGVVSQDTFIFNASVSENIAYGTEGASDEQIREAARMANALNFIEEFPEGFATILGDRGVRLSGGQRQRIAIARTLLRNPEILILDEATSALDTVSEKLIQRSIEILSKGRTVVSIAHRLSTISHADKVIVLDSGRIAEQGTYRELLEQKGTLWKYHHAQSTH